MVSVIIPNYNHASFLKQRIDSVLHQTFQDFELIILDDCSTDNSKAIIEAYRENKKISHVIYNQKNSGSPFKQWQKGLQHAKGEFIWIAESDDVADTEFLAAIMVLLENNTNCILATARTVHIDETGKALGTNLWPDQLDKKKWCSDFVNDGVDEITQYLRFRNTIPNASAVVFRNDVQAELQQLLQNDWKYNGDWFFWALLLMKGCIAYSARTLNYQRFHTHTTRSVKLFSSEEKRFRETVAAIKELNKFSGQKINWFDRRYHWIFNQLATRVNVKNKLKARYYFIDDSVSFALRLFWESLKHHFHDLYKNARFEGGAYKQKIFTFFKTH